PKEPRVSSLEGRVLPGRIETPFAYVRYNHVSLWPERPKDAAHRRKMPKKTRTPVSRFSIHEVQSFWPEGDIDRAEWIQLEGGWIEHWRLAVVVQRDRPNYIDDGEKW